MDITIHQARVSRTTTRTSPWASTATPGFEVRKDVGYDGMRWITADLDGTFELVQASGADVVQEPTQQPYWIRDCPCRDPAGNLIRIQELR